MTARPVATRPLVSVVLPCYNQARFLPDALDSLFRQPYRPIEAIVVDDGSDEDVRRYMDAFPGARYVRQANSGVSAARNAGFAASGGEYVVFLDCDDRLTPESLCVQLRALDQHPDALAAVGLCSVIGADGEPRRYRQQPPVADDAFFELLQGNFIWMPAQVLYRRHAFAASGGFDSAVNACADYDLYLRLARLGRLACHRAVVAEYRQHDANMSRNATLMLETVLAVLDRQSGAVHDHPAYRAARDRGRRFWREFYGEQIVEEIRARLHRPGRRLTVLPALLTLLRHHPAVVGRQLWRKLHVSLRAHRAHS